MASALALSILLVGVSCVSSSTDSPGIVHTLSASPVPPPPLEDPGTTPSPKAPAIVLAVSAVTPSSISANSSLAFPERSAKSIRFSSVSGNEVDGESSLSPEDELAVAAEIGGLSDFTSERESNPLSAFKGLVSECVWALSVACLQRKLLIFVNRISRRDRVGLIGDGVSLVRVWGDAPAAISEDILAERVSALSSVDPASEDTPVPDEEHLLDSLTQRALDDLFYSHAIRLKLPAWIGSFSGARSIGAIDIDLDDVIETGRQSQLGRKGIKIKIKKKKKKGGGKQMMKKMMKGMAKMGGMMMTMLLGKVAILAPFLKIISALALKASAIALLLSKILLVRQLFSSGFGGGGSGLSSIFSGLKGGLGGGGSGGGGGSPSSSYGAPSSGYSAPSSSYSSPSSSYGAPSSSYGTPGSSYSPPSTSYGTPSQNYRPAQSRPSSSYGVPGASSWSSAPTAPPAPSNSYGAPSNSYSPPSKDYGTPTGGGSSWSSGGGFSSTGLGASSGSSAGSSSGSVGGGSGSAAGGSSGGYVGGGAHWSNRRGWETFSVEATTESIEQYSQTN